MRKSLLFVALASLVLAQPWAVSGFKAVYYYHTQATGILALRGKTINGTITYEFLNITKGNIYMNVTMNLTITFINGHKRELVKSIVTKMPENKSTIFLTPQALKELKKSPNTKCANTTCSINVTVTRVLNTGIKVKLVGYSVFNTKLMLLEESKVTTYIYTARGRPLGRMTAITKLVKVIRPQGSGR